ncbi:hypothetical protein M413DRAFT_15831 [Hebeloma cylindrosporum]|uniref:25S rRNA (uridine-N(3))-methyltransferase BMT5-like domain-containing protein n=1 Tax=Hebeloma cylindrosporum TaxID=76867 RepID=A0A0C2YD24_HEBCY|nr:hypothetical protein M413DRAFT_15831 [Hebeloma cylindrosporum h7]
MDASPPFQREPKEKISHAAKVAEEKSREKGKVQKISGQSSTAPNLKLTGDPKGKKKANTAPLRRPTIPFRPTDKILLIGEGNFSFARALVESPPADLRFLPPTNVTATAYDTEKECCEKYPEAGPIISFLRTKGVEVIFGVDGTRLEKHHALKGRKWNRICWNFPHAGKGIADQDRNILSNQVLILGFYRSADKMLQLGPTPSFTPTRRKKAGSDDESEDVAASDIDHEDGNDAARFLQTSGMETRGTVLITLRNVSPYTEWEIPRLAKNPPDNSGTTPPNPRYILLRSFRFHRDIWSGYEHRMTKGERAYGKGRTGEGGEDRTWEFCLRDEDL